MDSRTILRKDIGFWVGIIVWPLLRSLYPRGQPITLIVAHMQEGLASAMAFPVGPLGREYIKQGPLNWARAHTIVHPAQSQNLDSYGRRPGGPDVGRCPRLFLFFVQIPKTYPFFVFTT